MNAIQQALGNPWRVVEVAALQIALQSRTEYRPGFRFRAPANLHWSELFRTEPLYSHIRPRIFEFGRKRFNIAMLKVRV